MSSRTRGTAYTITWSVPADYEFASGDGVFFKPKVGDKGTPASEMTNGTSSNNTYRWDFANMYDFKFHYTIKFRKGKREIICDPVVSNLGDG